MKIAKLAFQLFGSLGIASLGWVSQPDAFQQWLITGCLMLGGIQMALRACDDFADAP